MQTELKNRQSENDRDVVFQLFEGTEEYWVRQADGFRCLAKGQAIMDVYRTTPELLRMLLHPQGIA